MSAPVSPAYDAVIIGGGIAGLSTAWYLERQAGAAGAPVRYALLESADRWGGKVLTEQADGFVVEAGPDSFQTQKPQAVQLARELGIGDRLLGSNERNRKTYVLNNGRPTPLPDGVMLIVPTRFMPFVTSPLISPLGKLRMGLEMFIPARRGGGDETLAEFVTRRLGREALDKIAEPLMSGIHNSDAGKQSLLATFPRFRALEEQYGSLTRGILESRKHAPAPAAGAKPLPMFMTFAGGTAELTDALAARLSGDLRLRCTVWQIEADPAGGYSVTTDVGERLHTRAVVLATPAYAAASLLTGIAPQAANDLAAIRYVSTGTISLAFRQADVPDLRSSGLVVPRGERRPINAITYSSLKFDQRAPDGQVLIRVFFGGSRSPQTMELDDASLLVVVRSELKMLLGIAATPQFHRIYRWHLSNAQYDVGHLERVAAIENALPAGMYVTGSAYRGVGLPDCIMQGQETAARVSAELEEHGT
ncbi:MAG: protoporphyrinogen oxidase [Chloroflexi bacterium]|nr:protoporphyrinogen oxidase [Chloroflexota bacterium]